MTEILAVRDENMVEIFDHNGRTIIRMPYDDFEEIRRTFKEGTLLLEDVVIRPNTVVNYIEESDPLLLETEIEIEKNKERRKYKNSLINLMPYVIMFLMIIIGSAIAFNILHVSGGSIVNAVHNIVPHESTGPTLRIK